MYRMAVLDLDGTLLSRRSRITRYSKNIINTLQNRGIYVTICTGRNFKNTIKYVKQLSIKIPFICIDGTEIYSPSGKKLYSNNLERDEFMQIVEIVKAENVYSEFVVDNFYYKYIKNKGLQKYNFDMPKHIHRYLIQYARGVRYIDNPNILNGIESTYHQVIVGGKKTDLEQIKFKIKSKFGDRICIRDNLWRNFLFIHKKNISKSIGVNILCRHLDVDIRDVVAIGDELNDLDMIQKAGVGVAMGNANDKVKTVSDFVTKSNTKDGAAIALKKYFLED